MFFNKSLLPPQVEERLEGEEGDEVILNIKPMQPLVRASQYGYMRGLGLHQTRTVPPSLHVSRLGQYTSFQLFFEHTPKLDLNMENHKVPVPHNKNVVGETLDEMYVDKIEKDVRCIIFNFFLPANKVELNRLLHGIIKYENIRSNRESSFMWV